MIKAAIISPIDLLDKYSSPEVKGEGYHLMLSNLCQKNSDGYKDFRYLDYYRERSAEGDFIILDNSAHELGHGESFDAMRSIISDVRPSEVVVPDRLFFGEDTVANAEEFIPKFRKEYGTEIALMGVPQGRTTEEWDACAQMLISLGVDSIGISKDYEVWPGKLIGRFLVIKELALDYGLQIPVHMLGWGRDLAQIVDFRSFTETTGEDATGAWIRGTDSAKPLVYAEAGIKLPNSITTPSPVYPKRKVNYFELQAQDIREDLARHNIEVMRSWITQ